MAVERHAVLQRNHCQVASYDTDAVIVSDLPFVIALKLTVSLSHGLAHSDAVAGATHSPAMHLMRLIGVPQRFASFSSCFKSLVSHLHHIDTNHQPIAVRPKVGRTYAQHRFAATRSQHVRCEVTLLE